MKLHAGCKYVFILNFILYFTSVQSQKHSFNWILVENRNEYPWRLLGSSNVWGPQLCTVYCANNVNCDAYTVAEIENSQENANNYLGNIKYNCQLRQITKEGDSSKEDAFAKDGTTFKLNKDCTKVVSRIPILSTNDNTEMSATTSSDSTSKDSPNSTTTMPEIGCLPCNVTAAFYDNSTKSPVVICNSKDIYKLDANDACKVKQTSTISSVFKNYKGKTVTAAFNLKFNVTALHDELGGWYFYSYASTVNNSIASSWSVPDHIKNNKYHFATTINDETIILIDENNTYHCINIDEFYNLATPVSHSESKERTKKQKKENPGQAKKNNSKEKKTCNKKNKKPCKNENNSKENDNNGNSAQEIQSDDNGIECDNAWNIIPYNISAGERIDNLYYLFDGSVATNASLIR